MVQSINVDFVNEKNETYLLFIHDAGWSNPFDVGTKRLQSFHFFFCNVIWHDDG